MTRLLLVIFSLASVLPVSGQVVKTILLNSAPEGARVNSLSGRTDFIGNTPLTHSFDFHSDISVLKAKISACGYYDTIIKVTPQVDSLRIVLQKKKFLILPESQKDTLRKSEHKLLSLLLKDFLETFSKRNISQPINYMDFAVLRKSESKSIITVIFEVDPEYLTLSKSAASDSVMKARWNEFFAGSLEVFNKKQFSALKNTEYFFSVISGKKNVSVRYLPGIEQNDEFRVKTTVYEDDYKRVTTVTSYYETVTNPTFNTSLNQSQKYSELIYSVTPDATGKNYRMNGMAAISVTNNKVNLLYESTSGLSDNSMLTKFIETKR